METHLIHQCYSLISGLHEIFLSTDEDRTGEVIERQEE
jgi:hypothetical protein